MESLSCIIETPKGCNAKYNFNPELGCYELSKVLPAGLAFPFDFGFIPGTKGEDGDPLDVIVISVMPSFPGCAMKCRIIGAIKAIQQERDGERVRNDRYIAVPEVSVMYADIQSIDQLPTQILQELENFFINYNEQAGKKFKPLKWIQAGKAMKCVKKAQRHPEPTKLIQLLLPLYNRSGKRFPPKYYDTVKKKLTEKFGGVTAYTQSPVSGLWEEPNGKMTKDKMIIYEVMVSGIDSKFWKKFKGLLQKQFHQKELVIRQSEIGLL